MKPVRKSNSAVLLGADVLREGNFLRFCAEGSSMLPTLLSGDILWVTPIAAHEFRCGDIALCLVGDGLRAHRVVNVLSDALAIRGDAHGCSEIAVPFGRVLGKVVHVEATSLARVMWRALRQRAGNVRRLLLQSW